jgi:stress-induced morphogen
VIDYDALAGLIVARLPDAQVNIEDRTGTMDHFNVTVRSQAFRDQSKLDQHRLVLSALRAALDDGRIHAVELKTIVDES